MTELVGTLQDSWLKIEPKLEDVAIGRKHSWSHELTLRHLIKSHAWLNANLDNVLSMLKVPYSTEVQGAVENIGHYGQSLRLLKGRARDAAMAPTTPRLQSLTREAAELKVKALQSALHLEMLRKVPADFTLDIRRGQGYGDTQEDMVRLAEALEANWSIVDSIQDYLEANDPMRLSQADVKRMHTLSAEIERELNSGEDVNETRQTIAKLIELIDQDWRKILSAYTFAASFGVIQENEDVLRTLNSLRRRSTPSGDADVVPSSDSPAPPA